MIQGIFWRFDYQTINQSYFYQLRAAQTYQSVSYLFQLQLQFQNLLLMHVFEDLEEDLLDQQMYHRLLIPQ